jgi:hypothetical protein
MGSEKALRNKPKRFWGQVFDFKLGCFAVKQGLRWVRKRLHLKLKILSKQKAFPE